MQNEINYLHHTTYSTPYYHRQVDHDILQDPEDSYHLDLVKRVGAAAIPFLCLYQPLAPAISISMGTVRVVSHITQLDIAETALATLSLANSIFDFTLGLYVTTTADILTNLYHFSENYAAIELLQATGSALYLAILLTGSLEVILASLVLQAAISLYQAHEEWEEGRELESCAKVLMGMIRFYQAGNQLQLIQRRNELFTLEKYHRLRQGIKQGKAVGLIYNHPLLENVDEHQVILVDGAGNEYDFGAHFHGYGKGVVKGMNLQVNEVDGYTELDFKVNHVFHDRLDDLEKEIQSYSKDELGDLLKLMQANASHISVSTKAETDFSQHNQVYRVNLEGLGTISVGANEDLPTLYDRITVRMNPGKTLYDFHEALSYFGLKDVLAKSTAEDIERMKIGHLFRIFCPTQATPFERTEEYFNLPVDKLRNAVITKAPKMKEQFEKYLDQMELREILPGRMRYAVSGLADELRSLGAEELTAVITGAWRKYDQYEQLDSILNMGMISSEMRAKGEMNTNGLSSGWDYFTGGADSVFTQMVTDQVENYNDLIYSSEIRLLFSLEALETGSYQYHGDEFGDRMMERTYLNRPGIVDFVKGESKRVHSSNEVMIKERIPPELIQGIVVMSEKSKLELIEHLHSSGRETINDVHLDEFIKVEEPRWRRWWDSLDTSW